MTNDFIISWDCYGLEGIIDISGQRQRATMAILGDQQMPGTPGLTAMLMRARMNPQRNYEVYGLVCDSNITESDIKQMFDDNPQAAADLIRSKGSVFFSNREHIPRAII